MRNRYELDSHVDKQQMPQTLEIVCLNYFHGTIERPH